MKSNPIQHVVISRLKSLWSQHESANAISHMPTRGQLRERYLIDFFQDIVPKKYSIESGIICDASGLSSMQQDFIVSDSAFLPSMTLHVGVSIVPIESALLVAEIKTNLTKGDLKQIKNQQERAFEFRYTNQVHTKVEVPYLLPWVVLGFDTKVSEDTLKTWMKTNKNVVAICIINKFSILKLNVGSSEIQVIKKEENLPPFWETLVFVGMLYNALNQISSSRNIIPNWSQYMQGYFEKIDLENPS